MAVTYSCDQADCALPLQSRPWAVQPVPLNSTINADVTLRGGCYRDAPPGMP